jgi:hypothetical protein
MEFTPDSAALLRPAAARANVLTARMEKHRTKLQAKPIVSP